MQRSAQEGSPQSLRARAGGSHVLGPLTTAAAVPTHWQQHPDLGQQQDRISPSSTTRRSLHQVGPVYADMPGDLLGLESILAAARDAFGYYLEPGVVQQRQQPSASQQYVPRSRALGGVHSRSTRGTVSLVITFQSTHPGVEVHLPGPPRSFNVSVRPYGSSPSSQQQQGGCSFSQLPYADQEVDCQGLTVGSQWEATLVDAGAR